MKYLEEIHKLLIEQLKTFIEEECMKLTPNILENVKESFVSRLKKCVASRGHSVE